MTKCPIFLFIFLPGSISEQRGPGRSPSPALRALDLSRPPYRSEHLQNSPVNTAPMLIKATIHLPEGRRRGNRRGTGGRGAAGRGEAVSKQTQPAPKSFEKPHSATPTTVGPVGQEKEKEKKKSRICSKGPSAAPGQDFAGSARFQT